MNNTKPDYQLIYDMQSYGEGDTVDALEVLIETEDGTPQVPTEVCAQVKDAMDRPCSA